MNNSKTTCEKRKKNGTSKIKENNYKSKATLSKVSLLLYFLLSWYNNFLYCLYPFELEFPFSSVHFSHSIESDSLQPHESQHTRPLCPSPTPGVHSDSWSSSQWCHQAISSSVIPFSSCPHSLPASEIFPMSQLFAWGGQSTGVSALFIFFLCVTEPYHFF